MRKLLRVEFEDPGHRYWIEGVPAPSLSEVLESQFQLQDNPNMQERGLDLGSDVHKATHYFDENDLDESTLSDEVGRYLESWKRFKHKYRIKVLARERPTGNIAPLYGCTPDVVAEMSIADCAIIEIKKGMYHELKYRFQTMGQKLAVQRTLGLKPKLRMVVILNPDGKDPKEKIHKQETEDMVGLVSTVNLFNLRRKYGK